MLYDYVNNDGEGLPFNFTDAYGKVSFGSGNGSKLSLFGFNFTDRVNYQALSDLRWSNYGGGGNFTVVPSGSAILMNGHFAASDYEIRLKEEGLEDRYSAVNGFNFGLDFKYILGEDAGVWPRSHWDANGLPDVQLHRRSGRAGRKHDGICGYVDYRMNRGDWIINPSLRMQYYSSIARFRPEPRVGREVQSE